MDNSLHVWAEFVKVQAKGGLDAVVKITHAHFPGLSIMSD